MNSVTNFPVASQPNFFEQNQTAILQVAAGAATTALVFGLVKLVGHMLKPAEIKKLDELHANEKKAMKVVLKWLKKSETKLDEATFEDFQAWASEHDKDAAVSSNQFKKINGICREVIEEKESEKAEKSGKDKTKAA